MKILAIGSGGREHALAWKLAQSVSVEKIFVSPGNGGTALEEKCVNVQPSNNPETEEGQSALADFAEKTGVDFTIVGPEAPLAAGIVDFFHKRGLKIVGPGKKAAQLEASKVFAKDFMAKYGIRTAISRNFSDFDEALRYSSAFFAGNNGKKLVIKADGLAAGKGVVIAEREAEALSCLNAFMNEGSMGGAGKTVVLEEFLDGKEVSVLAAVSVKDGKGVIAPFVSARDHKRRFDKSEGPNTGGMGAIAPAPNWTAQAQADFRENILEPTLLGLKAEKFDYRGFLFFGLMVKNAVCSLLEYNVRLGDPETQAVLPLLDTDFVALCGSIIDGALENFPLSWKKGAVCAPVAVADGYPNAYRKGDPIELCNSGAEGGVKVFIAGAELAGGKLCTSGGRVLSVSAYSENAETARRKAYNALQSIRFDGISYRTDIGAE